MSAARATRKVVLSVVKMIRSVVHLCRRDRLRGAGGVRGFGATVLVMKSS